MKNQPTPHLCLPTLRRLARIATAALMLTLLGLPSAALAGDWSPSGHVYYSNGAAAANALVSLTTASGAVFTTYTNSAGAYALDVEDPQSSGLAALQAVVNTCSSPTSQIWEHDITTNLTIAGQPGGC